MKRVGRMADGKMEGGWWWKEGGPRSKKLEWGWRGDGGIRREYGMKLTGGWTEDGGRRGQREVEGGRMKGGWREDEG